jgi:sulfonate dioxygenase
MASGLVENFPDRTVDSNEAEQWHKKDQNQHVHSKEAFAQSASSTNYEAELKGSSKHPPAKVEQTARMSETFAY